MAMTVAILVALLVGLVFGFGLGRRHGVSATLRELRRTRPDDDPYR